MEDLRHKIETAFESGGKLSDREIDFLTDGLLSGLNDGSIRSAEPDGQGGWKVNLWVKQGILLLFRFGRMIDYSINDNFKYFDKHTIPPRRFALDDGVRLVPGGSIIRSGAYVAPGVICMPPMYINIGAYVDEGSMIDSHALVGTCAQIGRGVHLSAASQIGGVLEPAGARPVIVGDGAMIGGNCGVYEGVLIRERAVLGSGVILNASTRVYDIVNEKILRASEGQPLEIPAGAVVVPGSRRIPGEFAEREGLSVAAPMIVKYRDDKTDARTALEDFLR
ncbi:MAG: 2,3,4,5-tetrahydropyridine-2,6-dicarboxylate N-succinyltransferase [Candidatus Kapaibacterium sp.]